MHVNVSIKKVCILTLPFFHFIYRLNPTRHKRIILMILSFQADRSGQTMKEQSYQDPYCLPFHITETSVYKSDPRFAPYI